MAQQPSIDAHATDGQSIIIKKVSTTEWMLVASN